MIEVPVLVLVVLPLMIFVVGVFVGWDNLYRRLCRDPAVVQRYLKRAVAYAAWKKAMEE